MRCVLIEGVNDSPGHLAGIAALADRLDCIKEVHILPFHNTGNHKYTRLGREVPLDLPMTKTETKEKWAKELLALGLKHFLMDAEAYGRDL